MTTGNYGQSSYETPYNGGVPPGPLGGDPQSDTFNNTRPEWIDTLGANEVVPGYASLEAKWLLWDPADAAEMLARVNTRTQRAEFEASGKFCAGYYQQIPVPATLAETIELHLYAQAFIGGAFSEPSGGNIGPSIVGLMLADDLLNDPSVSTLRIAGPFLQQQIDGDSTNSVFGLGALDFVGFDALPAQAALTEGGSTSYVRFRLRQTMTGPDEWTTDIAFDASTSGADWVQLHEFGQTVGNVPQRSAGFAVYAGAGARVSVQLEQFILVRQAYDDYTSALGGVQQFGAV
jgi:hypothetical protein